MRPLTKCPKCNSPLEDGDCTECHWSALTSSRTRTQTGLLGTAAHVQLLQLVDRTGSGALFATGVALSTQMILSEVDRRVASLRVWLQTHGDEDFGEFPEMVAADCEAATAIDAVRTILYAGGGDDKETHLSAIEQALQSMSERPADFRTRRVMLCLVNDDTKPARSGRSASRIGAELREAGILFYLICQPTETLHVLTEAAGGMLCEISNRPSPELMQAIATQIAGSVIRSVSTGSVVPLPARLPHVHTNVTGNRTAGRKRSSRFHRFS